MRVPSLSTSCLVFALAAGASGQCTDPPTPGAGFAIRLDVDRPITYTDGYRTMADAVYPAAAPGPCGWPLLVEIHGFPNSKATVTGRLRRFARAGYFAVGYDVRGQGSGIKLNPGRGTLRYSLDEWIDLAEVIEWAGRAYPGLVDPRRVAVTGFSQGGIHSWAAAAFSGRTLPPNPRRATPFPVIALAMPRAFGPFLFEGGWLGGAAFAFRTGRSLYVPSSGYVLDPSLAAVYAPFLAADDPGGLYRWLVGRPGCDFRAELARTRVPVLAHLSWLDRFAPNNGGLDAFRSIPAGTPKGIVFTTGEHGTPQNAYGRARWQRMEDAWLRRWLKGAPEPVEAGPPVLVAALPSDPATYQSAGSRWRMRADDTLPPPDATVVRYHLRAGNGLSTVAPTSAEPADRIRHRVPPGYDIATWHRTGSGSSGPATVAALASLPLSEVTYATVPLAYDKEIAGRPALRLHVTPSAQHVFVGARVEAVSPGGVVQALSFGGGGVRGQAGARRLDIDMTVVDSVVPAGWRLRLRLRNHYLIEARSEELFRNMPCFSDYDVDIEHGPGVASSLDLPLRPAVRLDATEQPTELSLARPGRVDVQLQSSPAWQGLGYALLVSFTGQGPPLRLPGSDPLYLVPDLATQAFFAAAGPPVLPGFVGVLDARGEARAAMDLTPIGPLPAPPGGLEVHMAPVVLNGVRLETGAPFTVGLR